MSNVTVTMSGNRAKSLSYFKELNKERKEIRKQEQEEDKYYKDLFLSNLKTVKLDKYDLDTIGFKNNRDLIKFVNENKLYLKYGLETDDKREFYDWLEHVAIFHFKYIKDQEDKNQYVGHFILFSRIITRDDDEIKQIRKNYKVITYQGQKYKQVYTRNAIVSNNQILKFEHEYVSDNDKYKFRELKKILFEDQDFKETTINGFEQGYVNLIINISIVKTKIENVDPTESKFILVDEYNNE